MKKELLGDRVELIYGFSVRTDNEPKGKYPVYGSNGIIGFIDSFKVKGPGIIIGRKGTVGAVTYSSENFTPTDTTYYVALKDNTKDDLKFWYYYLQLIGLDKLNSHSTVPGLSRDLAYLKEIRVPEKAEQKLIADFLTVIDDKIALNKRINTELETLPRPFTTIGLFSLIFPTMKANPINPVAVKWNGMRN